MFLDNVEFEGGEDVDLYNQMGPGYAQFFKVFCFVLFMCFFPLAITGILNAVRNKNGHNCKTVEEINKIEISFKTHKGYQRGYLDRLFEETFHSPSHYSKEFKLVSSDLGLSRNDDKLNVRKGEIKTSHQLSVLKKKNFLKSEGKIQFISSKPKKLFFLVCFF